MLMIFNEWNNCGRGHTTDVVVIKSSRNISPQQNEQKYIQHGTGTNIRQENVKDTFSRITHQQQQRDPVPRWERQGVPEEGGQQQREDHCQGAPSAQDERVHAAQGAHADEHNGLGKNISN